MTIDGLGDVGLIALVAILPLVVLMLTSFVKISVVLSLLRNAIGATDAPSGLVIMGLSLVLTFFVMAPIAVEMVQAAATVPVPGGATGAPATPGTPGTPGATATGATNPPRASGRVSAETTGTSGPGATGTPRASGRVSGRVSAETTGAAGTGATGTPRASGRVSAETTGAAGTGATGTPRASGRVSAETTGAAGDGSATAPGTTGPGATEMPRASGRVSAETTGATGPGATGTPRGSDRVSAGTPAATGAGATDRVSAGARGEDGAAGPGSGAMGSARGQAGPPLDVEAALRSLVPAQQQGQLDALGRALGPLRRFLARHAGERDVATFVDLAGRMGHAADPDELRVLAPAFLSTELREAFAIAVLIFLPFLVIDLVVGLGLAALGLQQTSPQLVALPLKLLLFVAVDGWRLLIDSLLRGYV